MPDQHAKPDALDHNLASTGEDATTGTNAPEDLSAGQEGLAERDLTDRAAHTAAVGDMDDVGSNAPDLLEQAADPTGEPTIAERNDYITPETVTMNQVAAERTVYPAEEQAHNIAPSDADSAAEEYGWRIGTGDSDIGAADTMLHTDTALSQELTEELADTYIHPSKASIAEVLVEDISAEDQHNPDNIDAATLEAPSEQELLRRESEATMRQAVGTILDDEQADFAEVLAQSSPQEMVLLMESISEREIARANIRRVGQLKKQFDETYAGQLQHVNQQLESGDDTLIEEAKHQKDALTEFGARFSRALVSFNKRRNSFEETETTQRAANLESKRALLEELKTIVQAEDVAAIDKVRSIQARWRNVGQVPQADVDDVMQTYKTFLDRFYGLREKYNELLEQDRKINLEEKQKLILELETLVGLPHAPFTLPGTQPEVDVANAEAEAEAQAIALHFGIDVGNAAESADDTDTESDTDDEDAPEAKGAPLAEPASVQVITPNPVEASAAGGPIEGATPQAAVHAADLPAEKRSARFWQETADRVKQMHDAWKHIGPVPREWTEPLWARFKHATDVFYDQRRAFFGLRDEERGSNTARKKELVDQALQYLAFESTSKDAWMRASHELQALMETWKNTGPALQDDGKALFKQFRDAQNAFFKKRTHFFAGLNAQRGGMVEQKEVLLARAEALQTEPEGPAKAEAFKTLQREWKATGPDDYKESRKLAKRFRKIADTYFSGLKEQMASQYKEQDDNLARKSALLDQLEGLLAGEPSQDELEPLLNEYEQIGHVPFKQKDRINGRFRKVQDAYYAKFRRAPRRQAAYSTARPGEGGGRYSGGDRGNYQGGGGGGQRQEGGGRPAQNETANEREQRQIAARMRQLEDLLLQYENNVGFITRGKSGDSLRADMQQKIDAVKKEQAQLKQQLKDLRRQAANPAPAAEAVATPTAKAPVAEAAAPEAPTAEAAAPETATPEALDAEAPADEAPDAA